MTNKMYDILKEIALVWLPGFGTLYLALSNVWGLPFGDEVMATVTALDTFLGAILHISNVKYKG